MITVLRGRLSRARWSKLLGYSTNVVSDWEAGRRYPTPPEFLHLCSQRGWDVEVAVEKFHGRAAQSFGPAPDYTLHVWLDDLRGDTSIQALAERTSISRFRISRWLSGQTSPRLPDFLELLDAITGRAADFIDGLFGSEKIGALRELNQRRNAARRVAFSHPASEGILRILETDAYRALPKHPPNLFSHALGISGEAEAGALRAMEEAGVIRKEGERFVAGVPLTVSTTASRAEMERLKGFWMECAKKGLKNARDEDLFSYLVASVSEEDLLEVRRILIRAFREVRSLVAASEPIEKAALLQLNLLELGVAPPAS